MSVTTEHHARSDLGASRKMLGQMNRSERWLQIEMVLYHATNSSSLGRGEYERTLVIQANAHR